MRDKVCFYEVPCGEIPNEEKPKNRVLKLTLNTVWIFSGIVTIVYLSNSVIYPERTRSKIVIDY